MMKLSGIAEILNESFNGEDVDVDGVGSLDADCKNAIIYIENARSLEAALSRNPVALIVPHGLEPESVPYIAVIDPKLAFISLLEIFSVKIMEGQSGIDPNAHVDERAYIGNNVTIMTGAVVMEGARIDDSSVIYPNCVIEREVAIGCKTILYSGVIIREGCVIGDKCVIHSGAVIGADGYGFYEKDGKIIKIPQIGNVRIGNRVEIGANCCIDRSTVGSTEIGDDTKLDNMVQIAHNVKIGERCIIAAQAGISGSVKIGNHVTILGQVGFADHISVADETVILGQSGVYNDIKKADILFGTPARGVKEHHKIQASLKYLPELLKRVKKLERKIEGINGNSQDRDC